MSPRWIGTRNFGLGDPSANSALALGCPASQLVIEIGSSGQTTLERVRGRRRLGDDDAASI